MNDALPEIKFIEALVYLLKTLESQETVFLSQTISQFMNYLPENIQNALQKLFETNFSKEKPELIAAPVLLEYFQVSVLIK